MTVFEAENYYNRDASTISQYLVSWMVKQNPRVSHWIIDIKLKNIRVFFLTINTMAFRKKIGKVRSCGRPRVAKYLNICHRHRHRRSLCFIFEKDFVNERQITFSLLWIFSRSASRRSLQTICLLRMGIAFRGWCKRQKCRASRGLL